MAHKTAIPCVCLPSVGFTCKACAARKEAEPEDFKLEGGNDEPDLTGYGYKRADQDGYNGDGPEYVSPVEHKEEEFFEAARIILDASPIS